MNDHQQEPVLGQGQDFPDGADFLGITTDLVSLENLENGSAAADGDTTTSCSVVKTDPCPCRPGFSRCDICGTECLTKSKQFLFCIS